MFIGVFEGKYLCNEYLNCAGVMWQQTETGIMNISSTRPVSRWSEGPNRRDRMSCHENPRVLFFAFAVRAATAAVPLAGGSPPSEPTPDLMLVDDGTSAQFRMVCVWATVFKWTQTSPTVGFRVLASSFDSVRSAEYSQVNLTLFKNFKFYCI